MAMQDLEGKVAVVTGGASGIGRALTERFVAEGMRVVMADVEEARLVHEADRLAATGADVLAVLTDVTNPDDVTRLADQTIGHYGAVHVVCNNAGVAPGGPMLKTTPRDWQWSVGVNVLGVAYGVTTFGPILVAQGEGHIVNTASEAGLVTTNVLGMYCATKHAVVGHDRSAVPRARGHRGRRECVVSEPGRHRHLPERTESPPRPRAVERRERDDGARCARRSGAMGIAPTQVAAHVVDAIREDRFWVFTHESTLPVALARFEDLRAAATRPLPYSRRRANPWTCSPTYGSSTSPTNIAGPYASKLFVDAGAEVIKVEPGVATRLRRIDRGRRRPGRGRRALFQYLNAGKRSLVGRFADPDIDALVAGADLVCEDFGVADAIDIAALPRPPSAPGGAVDLAVRSRRAVRRPHRHRVHGAGRERIHPLPGPPDQTAGRSPAAGSPTTSRGAYAAPAALAAVLRARRTGIGEHIDVSMNEVMAIAALDVRRPVEPPRRPSAAHHAGP